MICQVVPHTKSVHRGDVEYRNQALITDSCSQVNRYVMLVVFFIPMICISFFEAVIDPNRNVWLREWVQGAAISDDTPNARDPRVTGKDAERGLVISKIPFTELIKEFPKTTMVRFQPLLTVSAVAEFGCFKSPEATILSELGRSTDALNKRINTIEGKMDLIVRLLQEKDK